MEELAGCLRGVRSGGKGVWGRGKADKPLCGLCSEDLEGLSLVAL